LLNIYKVCYDATIQDTPEPAVSTPAMHVNAEIMSLTSSSYFPQETPFNLYGKYVKKVLLRRGTTVKANEVCGRHLIPPVTPLPNSTSHYPTLAAEGFLKSMKSLGLRDIDCTADGKSILLCKRCLENMPTEPKTNSEN